MREDRGDYNDGSDFTWDPPPPAPPPQQTIPPGYQLNPQTGQLEPTAANLATPLQTGAEPDFNPNVNYDAGAWANGQPANAPAGWRWDPNLARFVQDANSGGGGGPVPPPAGPGAGSLIAPFTQPYTPAGSAAPGGGQPIGAPSSYLNTIPGAPQFPNIPRFQAPTMAEAMAEPGYEFALNQGTKNLENWSAARGTLNDSSTAKALIDYGQGAASTQYGNVWDRAASTYDRNVNTQYLDPFAAAYQTWMGGTVNPTMSNFSTQASNIAHTNDVTQQDNWNSWLQNWNIFRDQRDSTFNKQTTIATA